MLGNLSVTGGCNDARDLRSSDWNSRTCSVEAAWSGAIVTGNRQGRPCGLPGKEVSRQDEGLPHSFCVGRQAAPGTVLSARGDVGSSGKGLVYGDKSMSQWGRHASHVPLPPCSGNNALFQK